MIRAIVTILRGSVLAQVIGFAILPLLARNFSPQAFGHYQAFQAIIAFLLIAVTGRYEIAILRAADGRELSAVVGLCGILAMAIASLAALLIGLAQVGGWPVILTDLGFPWWLLPLAMLVGGWVQMLTYVATRVHDYSVVSNSKIAQAGANAGLSSLLAVAAPIGSGLIWADLAGRAASLAWLLRRSKQYLAGMTRVRVADMRDAAVRYRDLSMISLPSTLISTAGTSITPLLIYGNFDAATSGQFGLVERSIGLPVGLIVVAVSQVHMAHLASDLRTGGEAARRNFKRIAMLLGGIAIVPTVICAIFAPQLYQLVFGDGWDQAARFAQIMAPAYFFALITGGINMTLTVMARQKSQFAWDALRFSAMAMLWIYGPRAGWSIETMVTAHSTILASFGVIMLVMAYAALPSVGGRLETAGAGTGPRDHLDPLEHGSHS